MHFLHVLGLLMAMACNFMVASAQSSTATTKTHPSSVSTTTVSSTSSSILDVAPLPTWAMDSSTLFTAKNVSALALELPENLQSYTLSITTTAVCKTVHDKKAISYNRGHENMTCGVQTWASPFCTGKTEPVLLNKWKLGDFGSFSYQCSQGRR
ncbi:hypothetical protein QBC39DRAFT_343437 [Podospora conica]|nr:hypothetical protein QBC39DRAFT_343437 [Schizothecium conicum]